nr:RNase T2 protein [Pestalotiopsis microspora]
MPSVIIEQEQKVLAKALQKKVGVFKCLVPGTIEYSRAVFIGNLNYRMTMPAIIVVARTVEDVQATVVFARQNGVRLTVKNGGHSYMGYCLNEGGIVLDLEKLNGCSIDTDEMTITMEGGCIWKDVYYKLLQNCPENIIIGGQCPTVGVSGFTLGGGLSPFSRSYGLGCDNVIEMTIVTADGELVTVSAEDTDEKKRDLFWALRGGGGGNFGITVEFKSKIHRLQDSRGRVVCGSLQWDLTNDEQKQDFDHMMHAFNTTSWPDELCIDALWNYDAAGNLQGGLTVIFNGTAKKAYDVLRPLLEYGPTSNTLKQMHWTDWVHQAEGWDPKSEVYHHHASFIFAEGAITPEVNQKISNLVKEAASHLNIKNGTQLNAPKCHVLWDHVGGATERVEATDTPYFWRKGHYVSTVKAQWTDPAKSEEAMEFIAKCKKELLPYAIEHKAAYLNYIDGTVGNWEEAYYGHNYPRLQKVKSDWDPDNFFWNMQSVRPLKDGKAKTIKDEVSVPSLKVLLNSHEATQTLEWWKRYSVLVTPRALGVIKSDEQAYAQDSTIRQHLIASNCEEDRNLADKRFL